MLTPASSFHGLGYRLRGYRAGSSLRSCGSILLTYKQAELQSLSGWAVNTWSRFARQRVCEAFPPNYCPPRTPTSTPALAPSPAPAPAPAAIERKNKHREVFHFTSPYSVPSDAHGTTPCRSTRAYARAPVAYLPPLRLRRRLASAPRTMIASPAWFAKATDKTYSRRGSGRRQGS